MTESRAVSGILLPDKVYKVAKWAVQIVLPALATLYFTLSGYWGWPRAEEVVGSVAAISLALGVVLQLSSSTYNRSGAAYDGVLIVDPDDPDPDSSYLRIAMPPSELSGRRDVRLQVEDVAPRE